MSLPTVLITVGFSIDLDEIIKRLAPLSLIVVFKLFLMPLIGFVVFHYLFGGTGIPLVVMALACGMPTAIMAQSFASAMDADESLTAAAVSATTLFVLVSVPLFLGMVRLLFPGAYPVFL
jgi:predicted permease